MPDVYQTIVRPVVSEKSSAQFGALLEYAFEVHPDATKPEIRAAIEQLFDVHLVLLFAFADHDVSYQNWTSLPASSLPWILPSIEIIGEGCGFTGLVIWNSKT